MIATFQHDSILPHFSSTVDPPPLSYSAQHIAWREGGVKNRTHDSFEEGKQGTHAIHNKCSSARHARAERAPGSQRRRDLGGPHDMFSSSSISA